MLRVTGGFLSWLSDNPNPNFIVATSNSLRRMGDIGQTMTRSERFDACFFVDVPNRESRRKILERLLADQVRDPADLSDGLAQATERFSGADLRSIVKEAEAEACAARSSACGSRKRPSLILAVDEGDSSLHDWLGWHPPGAAQKK